MSRKRSSAAKRGGRVKSSSKRVAAPVGEHMEAVNGDVAGIDIGSEGHVVAVADDRDSRPVRSFGCYTPDIEAMADWLLALRVRQVVMESTGVYWVSAHRILTERGFAVTLVDRRKSRQIGGKTDVRDARWLRRMHVFGLLQGCFVPPADVTAIRTIWRHRESLVEQCADEIRRMQKALEQMNLHPHKALSDISGQSGMRMLRAIVEGARDPRQLAALADRRVKCSQEELVKAFTGHWLDEHLFTLKQSLATYDFHQAQMKDCDLKIQELMGGLPNGGLPSPQAATDQPEPPAEQDDPALPRNRTRAAAYSRRKNQPHFPLAPELARVLGTDLTVLEGIDVLTAQIAFTEVGTDVSPWPTEKHFSSWLCLCPDNRITGGKVKSSRTRPTSSRLANALRVAAQSLHHSKSALGAFYRRMKAKHGAAKATTATARKLAVLIYRLLKYGKEYVKQGQEEYERRYHEDCRRRLIKQARQFGMELVSTTTGVVVS